MDWFRGELGENQGKTFHVMGKIMVSGVSFPLNQWKVRAKLWMFQFATFEYWKVHPLKWGFNLW